MYRSGWWSYVSFDDKQPRTKVDRRLVRRILAYGLPHWPSVAVVLVTIIAVSLLDLIPPLLYRDLIDNVLPEGNAARLNLLALGMLGIPIASGLISVVQRNYSARAGEGIIYDLRQQLYEHLQRMSLRFFTHTKSGEIISRIDNDVVGAQSAITGTIPGIVTNLVTLISTLIVMISIEWRLVVLAVAVLPLFILPARRVARSLRAIRRQAMDYNADMSNIVSETLTINGALLVKTFGNQTREIDRYRTSNAAVRDIGVRRARVGQLFFMGLSIAGSLGTALIYWAGGHLVLSGAISTGTIVAFAAYLFRLYGPISALTNVQVEFAQSMVSFERVFEYLDKPIEIQDRPNAQVLSDVEGHVRFENVYFAYLPPPAKRTEPAASTLSLNGEPSAARYQNGDSSSDNETDNETDEVTEKFIAPIPTRRWALEDLSFEILPGQLAALVGPSGAGKTTITYLLPRLYEPTSGRISVDGTDLREVTLESLAGQIGMVTQESYLFHDTIRANLLYARPSASQAEVEAACRAANIHDFIASLPDGYETVVGERGYRLSGGEKQRLAIARVILKNPRILVLDEATSHLDSQNEALIQAALEPLLHGRTSLVIAHRLSTILAADIILVLDQGRIVEQGSHADLIARNGLYARLYATQFGGQAKSAPIPAPSTI